MVGLFPSFQSEVLLPFYEENEHTCIKQGTLQHFCAWHANFEVFFGVDIGRLRTVWNGEVHF